MAFLRPGQLAAMREHSRLVGQAKARIKRPNRTATSSEWFKYLCEMRRIESMSAETLRALLAGGAE